MSYPSGSARISPALIGVRECCTVGEALAITAHNAETWASKPLLEKVLIVDEVLENLKKLLSEWNDANLRRKGITGDCTMSLKFDQMTNTGSLAYLLLWARQLLSTSGHTGHPPQNYTAEALPDGRIRVQLQHSGALGLIMTSKDELILAAPPETTTTTTTTSSSNNNSNGAAPTPEEAIWRAFRGEPWLLNRMGGGDTDEPNTDAGAEAKVTSWWPKLPSLRPPRTMGTKKKVLPPDLQPAALQHSLHTLLQPGVTAILGAGNFDIFPDVLGSLLCEHRTVVYKPHPLMEPLLPLIFRLFKPFLLEGALRIVQGEAEVAMQLVHDPRVTKWVHTGHAQTAAALLFNGKPPAKDADLAAFSERLALKKPFVTELGGHAGCIIAPSVEWSERELKCVASHIAFHSLTNGGHYCCKLSTIVTCREWPQRREFVQYVKDALMEADCIPHWYPGTEERFAKIKSGMEKAGANMEEVLLKPDLLFFADAPLNCPVFKEELFCRALLEVALDTQPTPQAFLPAAVKFCNEELMGNLCGAIFCKPGAAADSPNRTISQSVNAKAVDEAAIALECSCVGVNVWAAGMIAQPWSTWTGYPGSVNCETLVSGMSAVTNIYGFRHPLKTLQTEVWMSNMLRAQGTAPETVELRHRALVHGTQYLCKSRGALAYVYLAKAGWSTFFI